MISKNKLRQKFLSLRKKRYFDIRSNFFDPLLLFIKKKYKKKKIFLSIYYPSNFEVNIIKFFYSKNIDKISTLLPVIFKNNKMKFFKWNNLDPLTVNRFGILEPEKNIKDYIPDIILVPLLAYDEKKYRLGYGKGYYDRYMNKHLINNKKILKIGIAFSFQKHHNLPVTKFDVKLDHILSENGLN
jgi:5-formyltetrahydrofolate cyclo-ligase